MDLSRFQSHPQFYIIEKYKVGHERVTDIETILDRILSINDVQVLKLNSENGDILWHTTIPQHIKHSLFLPQQQ